MMTDRISFDAFGVVVTIDVVGGPALVAAVHRILPPGHIPLVPGARADASLAVTSHPGRCSVYGADGTRTDLADETEAVHALDLEIRAVVALHAPHRVFVHAGVVAGRDGAVVMPGRSFNGKTSLVDAMLEAGASYLSDEYAVLDRTGGVWPYPRSLSFRTPDGRRDVPAAQRGWVAARGPHRVALVVSTSYWPGAPLALAAGTPEACSMALIDNAVAARTRSADVVQAAAAAARQADFVCGARGEAPEAAAELLRLVGGPPPRRLLSTSAPSTDDDRFGHRPLT